jgi:hypothetical protein
MSYCRWLKEAGFIVQDEKQPMLYHRSSIPMPLPTAKTPGSKPQSSHAAHHQQEEHHYYPSARLVPEFCCTTGLKTDLCQVSISLILG